VAFLEAQPSRRSSLDEMVVTVAGMQPPRRVFLMRFDGFNANATMPPFRVAVAAEDNAACELS
jgi:hypothetical protein